MAAPVKHFNSTQNSAPTLTGENTDKIPNLLYNCLVTGYNSKTVSSLILASNVVTCVTSTAHNYSLYDVINISGANESLFNDDFMITSIVDTTTFTFALIDDDQTATGVSITCKIAPLGWERVYSGTAKAVFRSQNVESPRCYLRVADTQTYYSIVDTYEKMFSVDVGEYKTSETGYWKRSTTTNNTTRSWQLVGNDRCFYFNSCFSSTYPTVCDIYFFGDFISYKPNEYWNSLVSFTTDNGSSSYYYSSLDFGNRTTSYPAYIARNLLGHTGYSTAYFMTLSNSNPIGNASPSNYPYFPNIVDNKIRLCPDYIIEFFASGYTTNSGLRGKMPGILIPLESIYTSFGINSTFTMPNNFLQINNNIYLITLPSSGSSGNARGLCFFDLSNDWFA